MFRHTPPLTTPKLMKEIKIRINWELLKKVDEYGIKMGFKSFNENINHILQKWCDQVIDKKK